MIGRLDFELTRRWLVRAGFACRAVTVGSRRRCRRCRCRCRRSCRRSRRTCTTKTHPTEFTTIFNQSYHKSQRTATTSARARRIAAAASSSSIDAAVASSSRRRRRRRRRDCGTAADPRRLLRLLLLLLLLLLLRLLLLLLHEWTLLLLALHHHLHVHVGWHGAVGNCDLHCSLQRRLLHRDAFAFLFRCDRRKQAIIILGNVKK